MESAPLNKPRPTEDEALGYFEAYSNAGRWGDADELGTLNLITPEHRVRAAGLVQRGVVVSLSHALTPADDGSFIHRMLRPGPLIRSAEDMVEIAPHGYRVTHLDALGHVSHGGRIYNHRSVEDVMSTSGLSFGSIFAARQGVFTRGFYLDVAGVRGVPFLQDTDAIEPEDLDAAAALCESTIEPGDAVLIRAGLGARAPEAPTGHSRRRAGLSPRCIGWLRERDIAVYGGDCVEQQPSGYRTLPLPFHAVALSAIGLCILDNVDMESLASACNRLERRVFLLIVAPLAIPRGTGSAVNPLAAF